MPNDIYAHRGWSGKAPENTMAAFRMALDAPYVTGIELDVQLSSDGVPVVIHDFTLERTTTGKGLVKEHSLKQLKRLDAGSWFGKAFRGERIPTLAEVLEAAKGRGKVNIELKTAGNLYPELPSAVVREVRKAGMAQEAFLTSFDHHVMKEVKMLAPDIRTGLIVSGRPVAMRYQFEVTGADVLSIAYPYLTEDLVKEAEVLGIGLFAWTINGPEDVRRVAALSSGIAICTNYPKRVNKVLHA